MDPYLLSGSPRPFGSRFRFRSRTVNHSFSFEFKMMGMQGCPSYQCCANAPSTREFYPQRTVPTVLFSDWQRVRDCYCHGNGRYTNPSSRISVLVPRFSFRTTSGCFLNFSRLRTVSKSNRKAQGTILNMVMSPSERHPIIQISPNGTLSLRTS